jgi:hypothetical protein
MFQILVLVEQNAVVSYIIRNSSCRHPKILTNETFSAYESNDWLVACFLAKLFFSALSYRKLSVTFDSNIFT